MASSIDLTGITNVYDVVPLRDGSISIHLEDDAQNTAYLELNRDVALALWSELDTLFTTDETKQVGGSAQNG